MSGSQSKHTQSAILASLLRRQVQIPNPATIQGENHNEKVVYHHPAHRYGGSVPDGRSGRQQGSEHQHVFDGFHHHNQEGKEAQEEQHGQHGKQHNFHQHVEVSDG
jgi:hypothetical protein